MKTAHFEVLAQRNYALSLMVLLTIVICENCVPDTVSGNSAQPLRPPSQSAGSPFTLSNSLPTRTPADGTENTQPQLDESNSFS